jgi:hypothetical protein
MERNPTERSANLHEQFVSQLKSGNPEEDQSSWPSELFIGPPKLPNLRGSINNSEDQEHYFSLDPLESNQKSSTSPITFSHWTGQLESQLSQVEKLVIHSSSHQSSLDSSSIMTDEDLFHLYPPDKYFPDPCPIEPTHIKATGERQFPSLDCAGLLLPLPRYFDNVDQSKIIRLAGGDISIRPPSHPPLIPFLSRVKLKPIRDLIIGLIVTEAVASGFKHWRAWCSTSAYLTWYLGIRWLVPQLKNLLRSPTLQSNSQLLTPWLTGVLIVFCGNLAKEFLTDITAWKTQRPTTKGAARGLLPLPVGTGSGTESALGRKFSRKSLSPHEAVLFVLCTKRMVDRLTTLRKAHCGLTLLMTPRFPTMASNNHPREISDNTVELCLAAPSSEAAGEAAALLRIGDG